MFVKAALSSATVTGKWQLAFIQLPEYHPELTAGGVR
jgi:hypothetical protein